MLTDKRSRQINSIMNVQGSCVLYYMSRDQRIKDNFALSYAQKYALELKLPLTVVFNLYSSLGNRSRQQFLFMLKGLHELETKLHNLNIDIKIVVGDPIKNIRHLSETLKPAAIFCDFSPLKHSKIIRLKISQLKTSVVEVDTHNIVPVWAASNKQEFAARTIRPKLHKLLPEFIEEACVIQSHPFKQTLTKNNWYSLKQEIKAHNLSNYSPGFLPGSTEALQLMHNFIKDKINKYEVARNNPALDGQSNLSPYLHFGQLSSFTLVKTLWQMEGMNTSRLIQGKFSALIEEIFIRKELSDNYCYYNENYNNIKGIPDWAQKTLAEHSNDKREYLYSLEGLESAATHDPAWNAAQTQMVRTGKMHGYLRMYWAKKILEWSKDPEEAIINAIYLNDKYELDGLDPNGYVGILWSIGGLHDRPWTERPIFGKVRFMNYNGLKRKFAIEDYIKRWQ